MRIVSYSLLICCALMIGGCGADKLPEKDQQITTPANQKSGSKASPTNKIVAPAADAQWTIYCYQISGPGHVEQVNQMKSQLEKVDGLNAWHALHDEEKSSLYYGYYKTRSGADIVADRKKIVQLRDDRGDAIFSSALAVPLDAPDPTSPPEWNLVNSKGYWSVQVAAFQGEQQRKQAAVDLVREWRQQNIEAYYYHGENVSSVCVGSFPESALTKQEADRGEAIDPNQPLMVINGDLPENMRRMFQSDLKDRDGNKVRVFVQKVEVVDPNMLAVFKDFPVHRLNYNEEFQGYTDPKTGKAVQYPKPCAIVAIPRKEPVMGRANLGNQPGLINPTGTQSGGTQSSGTQSGGRLRRVGE